jgi:hypothetical protein
MVNQVGGSILARFWDHRFETLKNLSWDPCGICHSDLMSNPLEVDEDDFLSFLPWSIAACLSCKAAVVRRT